MAAPDLKTCAIKRTDLFRQSRMYHRQNLSECSPEFAYYPYFFDVIGAQVTDGGEACFANRGKAKTNYDRWQYH